MKLTSQLHLMSILKSGAIPLFPLYAFMAQRGTAAPFLPFITIRIILRYFEGISLHFFFIELLIRSIAIWSLSQPAYILYDVSVT